MLETARVHGDLQSALAGAAYVVAFSARPEVDAASLDVREAAAEISKLGFDERAALVFGPESSGLTFDDLAFCGRLARIPTHPDQPSLNLSHAVAIAAYEVFRATRPPEAPAPRPTHDRTEEVLDRLRVGLEGIGMLPAAHADRYFREWRRLIHRADLTRRELGLLDRLARRMARLAGTVPSRQRRKPTRVEGECAGQQQGAFADLVLTDRGFSIPQLKWRELVFTGALTRRGRFFTREPGPAFPPFENPDLFPVGVSLRVSFEQGRVHLERVDEGG